jgi:16S rRNA (cytosine1402-N4)-methyltransferase
VAGDTHRQHEPVLVNTLLRLLEPQAGDVILDGTVGLGGHAAAFLPRIAPNGKYIGLDLDATILDLARNALVDTPSSVLYLIHGNYADFPSLLPAAGVERVNHMLLDLGVNSAQLSDPARGFSFDHDGPLDMRYDHEQAEQALDLVNRLSENELADLFYQFGQEGASRKIAKRICQIRHTGRIRTTKVLASAVESVFASGRATPRGKVHPATRVFQALRVAVNRELENLERFLQQAPQYLAVGGKLAVISFHSLEDGIVKRFVRQNEAAGTLREITKRPVGPDDEERVGNPRSRSAKLRVAERVAN